MRSNSCLVDMLGMLQCWERVQWECTSSSKIQSSTVGPAMCCCRFVHYAYYCAAQMAGKVPDRHGARAAYKNRSFSFTDPGGNNAANHFWLFEGTHWMDSYWEWVFAAGQVGNLLTVDTSLPVFPVVVTLPVDTGGCGGTVFMLSSGPPLDKYYRCSVLQLPTCTQIHSTHVTHTHTQKDETTWP